MSVTWVAQGTLDAQRKRGRARGGEKKSTALIQTSPWESLELEVFTTKLPSHARSKQDLSTNRTGASPSQHWLHFFRSDEETTCRLHSTKSRHTGVATFLYIIFWSHLGGAHLVPLHLHPSRAVLAVDNLVRHQLLDVLHLLVLPWRAVNQNKAKMLQQPRACITLGCARAERSIKVSKSRGSSLQL